MTKIGIAGDWHGNDRWACSAIRRFAENGIKTVYQVGDFGIWRGYSGEMYQRSVNQTCKDWGVTLWITPGNHENYDMIEDPENDEGIVPPRQILAGGEDENYEVALLPRGYRWELGGRNFVSFGGAPSIDRWMRTPNKDWWAAEMIRESDLLRLETDEAVDVMICHDTANSRLTDKVRQIVETPLHLSGWTEQGLRYAAEGREILDRAVEIVKPQLLFHGHYHVKDQITHEDGTETVSLNMDGMGGNMVVLDLETLEVIWGIDEY